MCGCLGLGLSLDKRKNEGYNDTLLRCTAGNFSEKWEGVWSENSKKENRDHLSI